MRAKIELTDEEIRQALNEYISRRAGIEVASKDIKIEVKSKQNYRSEWEEAAIRCNFEAAVSS